MQKTNFTQLAAFGSHNEKTYRSHFEKSGLDTVAFNLEMAKDYFEGSIGIKALAIDPSYVSKTGRHTLHLPELSEGSCKGEWNSLFHQQSEDSCTWAISHESIYLRVWDFRRQRFNYKRLTTRSFR